MHIRDVDAGGVSLAVREWAGSGVPLLAWHGLGEASSGSFVGAFAGALAQAGIHPRAVDAPGFGRSPAVDPAGYAVDRLASSLLAAADALELGRPLLLGHSWGAAVVLEAARQAPERVAGVVLLDAGHADYADMPTVRPAASLAELTDAARRTTVLAASWAEIEREFAAAYPGRGELVTLFREGVRLDADGTVLAGPPAEVRGAAMHAYLASRPSAAWPALRDAGVPALFLLATVPELTDRTNRGFVPILQAAWPEVDVIHVEGGTHTLYTELGEELGRIVGDWARGRGIA